MQVDQLSGDIKSQAKTGAVAIDRFRVLVETFKNQGEGLSGNASTGITDRNVNKFGVSLLLAKLYVDRSFKRCELDGVVDQVNQNFEHPVGIGKNQRQAR